MERILTNKQVEWLYNIKMLSKIEDDAFPKEEMAKKLYNLVENEYPGEEEETASELQVLKEKGFLTLEFELSGIDMEISDVNITKKGVDYLTMLKEELAEKLASDQKLADFLKSSANSKKDVLDYMEQTTTILSNVLGIASPIGSFCQGAIPFFKEALRMGLKKKS